MMVQRLIASTALVLSAVGLVACGEQPQEMAGQGVKQDNAPYQGVGSSQYATSNWKQGARASWEQQLKTRAQYGQNDNNRISN